MSEERRRHAAAEAAIEMVYEANEGSPEVEGYFQEHGIDSMSILTVGTLFAAEMEALRLRPRISGKTVIEIGSGVGMLALAMARDAKRVYAIEADPAWSWVFVEHLYALKPPNLTWIFGAAQEMVGRLRGDIAVVYTRSDCPAMVKLAYKFAPEVIVGPLCSFEEAHPEAVEYIEEMERVAIRLSKTAVSRHGLSGAELRAALLAEVTQRCPP